MRHLLGMIKRPLLGVTAVAAMATTAMAGIPQPPLVYLGQIYNGANIFTSGSIQMVLTPVGGGAPVTVSAPLASLVSGGDTLSYVVKVPVIDNAPGGQSSAGKLVLSSTSTQYNRVVTVKRPGQPDALKSDVVTLGATQQPGVAERFDINLADTTTPTPTPTATPTPTPTSTPTPTPGPGCAGDADKSGFVNLNDYRSVRDNFGQASPAFGDANGDGFVNLNDYRSVRDNFGKSCTASKAGTPLLLEASPSDNKAAGTRLFLSAPATSSIGNTVTVQVRLDADTEPVGIASVFLLYDTTRLSFVSGTINTTTFNNTTFTTPVSDDSANGVVSFSAGGNSPVSTNNVLVATLQFNATGAGAANFAFSTANPRITELTDSGLDNISAFFNGASTNILAANTALVSVSPASQNVTNGGNFSVQVNLAPNGTTAAGAGVFLQYNPAVIDFTSGTVNSAVFNNGTFTSSPTEASAGIVSFAAFANSTVTSDATLATLNFTAIANGTSSLDLLSTSPTVTEVTDTNLTVVSTALTSGTVTVLASTPTPTPTPTSTATPTPTPTPNPGAARVISVPATLTGTPGTEVEVRVVIDNADNVAGYRLGLGWNTAQASYVANSVTSVGTLTQGCFAPSVNSGTAGSLIISSACTNVLTGPGTIIRFRLLIDSSVAAGATIPITFDTTQTRLNDGAIPSTTTAGTVTIGQPFLWGDVACPIDGIAGTLDVSAILRFDAGLLTTFSCFTPVYTAPNFPPGGDVNGDNILGVLDASLVLRADALLISRFPADTNGDGFGPDTGGPVNKLGTMKAPQHVVLTLADSAAVHGVVDVPVQLNDGTDVFGYRLGLQYDGSVLGVPTIKLPAALNGWIKSPLQSSEAGVGAFSAAGMQELGAGSHSVAILSFPVLNANAITTEVSLTVDGTRVNDGEMITHVVPAQLQLAPSSSVVDWTGF